MPRVNQSTTPNTNPQQIAEIKVTRNGELQLYVKSSEIARFFKTHRVANETNTNDSLGNQYYRIDQNDNNLRAIFNYCGRNNILLTNVASRRPPNLFHNSVKDFSVLRMVGIENGVTITLDTPYSTGEIQDWISSIREFIRFIYTVYMKRVEFTLEINERQLVY